MKKYWKACCIMLVLPTYMLGQDMTKMQEIQKLHTSLDEVEYSNRLLSSKLDSLKKVDLDYISGFYLRFESDLSSENSLNSAIKPNAVGDLSAYSIGTFKNCNDAASLSKIVRSFNLSNYKVIFKGNYYSQGASPPIMCRTMWVEDY